MREETGMTNFINRRRIGAFLCERILRRAVSGALLVPLLAMIGCMPPEVAPSIPVPDSRMGASGPPARESNWVVPSCNLEMIWISPGAFVMGSPDMESGRDDDEGPQHKVTLTKGFWVGKYEVTQAQWVSVMGRNPSWAKGGDWGRPNNPVECVTWQGAMNFCKELNEIERAEHRLPDGYEYTLPTEAQWEYANRAGSTAPYPDDLCAISGEGKMCLHAPAVGLFKPNAWGLYDMWGLEDEWCFDWYSPYTAGDAVDPAGPEVGTLKVARGGSWGSFPDARRSANRITFLPNRRHIYNSFRLVLAPVPKPQGVPEK